MHLVGAILTALILFNWLQTGFFWDMLVVMLFGALALAVIVAAIASPVFGVIVVLGLIACSLYLWQQRREQAEMRRRYPDPAERYEAEQRTVRRKLNIPDPPDISDPQWAEWRRLADRRSGSLWR